MIENPRPEADRLARIIEIECHCAGRAPFCGTWTHSEFSPILRAVTVYSHSRINCFSNCPKQFSYRYIEKIKVDTEGVEAFVGKRVHEILERLYHHLQRHSQPPSLAQVQERFRKDFALRWHKKIKIVREENDQDFYIAHGLRCLENYYRGHYPFDRGETVAIEARIPIQLDDGGRYRAQGIIDRLVRTRDGEYEVHDYKTSAALPPKSRMENDHQLPLYQVGVQQAYPDADHVKLVWHYLAVDKTIVRERTPVQLSDMRKLLMEKIDTIEAATEFKARPSPLCNWCDYNSICPDRKGGPKLEEPPPPGDTDAPSALSSSMSADDAEQLSLL